MMVVDKQKQGRSNRRRGGDFEREFCRWVRDEFGITFGRNLKQWAEAQEGDTDPLGPFLPECKNQAKVSKRAWWQQTVAQAKRRGLIPLLVYKIPRAGWRAILPNPEAWATGKDWRYEYHHTREVDPASLALIVREHLA